MTALVEIVLLSIVGWIVFASIICRCMIWQGDLKREEAGKFLLWSPVVIPLTVLAVLFWASVSLLTLGLISPPWRKR